MRSAYSVGPPGLVMFVRDLPCKSRVAHKNAIVGSRVYSALGIGGSFDLFPELSNVLKIGQRVAGATPVRARRAAPRRSDSNPL